MYIWKITCLENYLKHFVKFKFDFKFFLKVRDVEHNFKIMCSIGISLYLLLYKLLKNGNFTS